MGAGHGGQVLLSQATRELIDGGDVRDLGEHRLKDFDEPMRLFQLGPVEFPPLKTLNNTNLPIPGSSFLGRERELSKVTSLLSDGGSRLITLTGPGGSTSWGSLVRAQYRPPYEVLREPPSESCRWG